MNLYKTISAKLIDLEHSQSLRQLKDAQLETEVQVDLSTNDYLSIASNSKVRNDFIEKNQCKLSASSSRLLSGNHTYYTKVEALLSELYFDRDALFFNSGYHLNIGVLPTLTNKNDLILADKLVHASLIEGMHLSYAKSIRYKHLDYQHLETLLEKYQDQYENIFIVTESVFSMDGDIADLKTLVALKDRYKAYLYVDEAHAVGVCGAKGLGCLEAEYLIKDVDFIVGTMGKALASVGAYLICEPEVKSFLVNQCKSQIYTTALPPINMAWTEVVLRMLPSLTVERASLKENQKYLQQQLQLSGIPYVGTSHILAIILGDNKKCIELAEILKLRQIKVQAIRPPTVPQGTSRLRISLHSALSTNDIDLFVNIIKQNID